MRAEGITEQNTKYHKQISMAKQGSHSNFSSSSLTSFKFSSSMLPAPCTHKEY